MTSNSQICVRPYHIEYADRKSCYKSLQIRIWAMDKDDNLYLLRVENFAQTFYIKLPLTYNGRPINWDQYSVSRLHASIARQMNNDPDLLPYDPSNYVEMETLYDVKLHPIGRGGVNEALTRYINKDYRKFPMLQLGFKTMAAMYKAKRLLEKVIDRGDGQEIEVTVCESEIDPIFKLLTHQDFYHCSWITADALKIGEQFKISDLENEYAVVWQTIKEVDPKVSESWQTRPSIVGFDIEAYSDKHRMFPKGNVPEHDAICISVTWAKDGAKKSERQRYLIVQGDINHIPLERFENVKTIRVENQGQLVDWMCQLIRGHNANVIITYNGLGFDYDYLNKRLALNDYEWTRLGLIKEEPMWVKNSRGWESAAYGVNRDVLVNMPGRLNFDMYKIVRRDFKLSEYKLGKVGLHFKLGTKDDISPEYMFKAYEHMKEAMSKLDEAFPGKDWPIPAHIAYRIYKSFTLGDAKGLDEIFRTIDRRIVAMISNQQFVDQLKASFEKAKENGFDDKAYEEVLDEMTKVAIYCIQDVELCFDLYEHFNLWVASNETSNIVGINIIDLYSRGQQIRCLSQLYRVACKNKIVMDMQPVRPIPFIGGLVIDPEVGLHDNVLVLDFKSLYPLIMIAYNICYTTFVPEDLWRFIPIEWCNVIVVDCNENFDPSIDMMDVDEEDKEHMMKKGKKFCDGKKGTYEFRYIKREIREGLLPRLVNKLVNSRDDIVNLFKVDKTLSKTSGRGLVLDKRQLGLKVSANSFFGFQGVLKNGKRPFRQGAISITAWGRKSIQKVIDFLKTTYNARIIYGDTDSCMVCLDDHIKSPDQCEYWMNKLSKEITNLFPKPMQMKPEYAARMLALMKKKYLMMPYMPMDKFRRNPDGSLMPGGQFFLEKDGKFKIETKGVLSARRDNCEWACNVFDTIAYYIMTREEFMKVMDYLIDELQNLLAGKVSYENFVITRSLRDNYKSKSYFMKVFSDILIKLNTPAQPGERLPYIVYDNPEAELVGQKMMLRDRYLTECQKGTPPKIDYIYYVDKILTQPVDQLISAAYKKEINYLHEVAFRRSNQCNYVHIDRPVAMAVQHMTVKRDLEDMRATIKEKFQGFTPEYQIVDHNAKTNFIVDISDEVLMYMHIMESQQMYEQKFASQPIILDQSTSIVDNWF